MSALSRPVSSVGSTELRPPASKRRRVSIACKSCRSRKSRCSGCQPCSMCVQLGVLCEFEQTVQGENLILPQVSLLSLQEQLKSLEELVQLSRHKPGCIAPQNSISQGNPSPIEVDKLVPITKTSKPISVPVQVSSSPRFAGQEQLQVVGRISHEQGEANAIDGMAITVSEGNQSAFFGPSSNTAFLQQIQSLAWNMAVPSPKDCIIYGAITVTRPSQFLSTKSNDAVLKTDEFVLPSQPLLEGLINVFFRHAALFFPYLHEPTFRATFAEMKASGFRSARRTWLALLNMVLAIASKLSQGKVESSQFPEIDQAVYYLRALKLCNEFMFCASSVEMVQCLLLMAWHLQGSQDSTRTWFIHGVVVRAAISLGLHLRSATDDLDEIEEETRIRVWYGCIALDRILGLSFGRPWAIQKVLNPSRKPRSILSWSDPNFETVAAARVEALSVHFLNETTSLHDITVDVISAFYGDNYGFSQPQTSEKLFSEVMPLACRLEAWWENVHPHVRWRPGLSSPSYHLPSSGAIELMKAMLKLDFLNVQLLLYRPVVFFASKAKLSSELEEHSLSYRMMSSCVRKSLSAAHLLITTVQNLQRSSGPLAGAPWLSLYHTFHAALCSFSIMLLTPHLIPRSISESLSILENAVLVLKSLAATNNKMGQACAQYVQLLIGVLRNSDTDRSNQQFPISRPQTPLGSRPTQNQPILVSNSLLQAGETIFGDVPDLDLAHFFTQDQTDYFGLDGPDNSLMF